MFQEPWYRPAVNNFPSMAPCPRSHVKHMVCSQNGLGLHLDGARLFNASVALEVPAKELVREVDDVSFCLSKALSCQVGSVLCGSREFIAEALRWRKMVGGGMRQAGVLAAAGLTVNAEIIRAGWDYDERYQAI